MRETPPSEAIRLAVGMHVSLLSRQTRRDYAGFAIGKRRKLAVVPIIAREMAKRILQQVIFEEAGAAVEIEGVAKRIEAALLSFPEADAFRIVSDDRTDAEAARDELVHSIMVDLLRSYSSLVIGRNESKEYVPPMSNGWKMWEVIAAGEQPSYRWQRTWSGKADDDFIGFDHDKSIGRIFRIDHIQQKEKWFWLLGYPGTRMRRDVPASGWEDTMRQAACRVERCYKSIMELNRAKSA